MSSALAPGEVELVDALAELGPDAEPSGTFEELAAGGDGPGLIALGARHRAGDGLPRDLAQAVTCFQAAAEAGDVDATCLVGLAYLNGLGVPADQALGAERLREAAEHGSRRATVYLANLYEMGVHVAADPEEADRWYRQAAKMAGLGEADPEGEVYELGMAELGALRYCMRLIADDGLPTKDRAFYLQKAKAMGYRHRLQAAKRQRAKEALAKADAAERRSLPQTRPSVRPVSPMELDPTMPAHESDPAVRALATSLPPAPKVPSAAAAEEAAPVAERASGWTVVAGLGAWLCALFFAAAGWGAGFLAMFGADAPALHEVLPQLDVPPQGALAATVLLLGVLPATVTYRPLAVFASVALGAGGAALGFFLHAEEIAVWFAYADQQAVGFGLAVHLGFLFFIGLRGGTRLDNPAW